MRGEFSAMSLKFTVTGIPEVKTPHFILIRHPSEGWEPSRLQVYTNSRGVKLTSSIGTSLR